MKILLDFDVKAILKRLKVYNLRLCGDANQNSWGESSIQMTYYTNLV